MKNKHILGVVSNFQQNIINIFFDQNLSKNFQIAIIENNDQEKYPKTHFFNHHTI